MLKRSVFIVLLLLFFAVCPLYSQSILVEKDTLLELQNLNNSLNSQLVNIMNSLIQRDLELEKWVGKSKEQEIIINKLLSDLKKQELTIEEISKSYEEQLTIQEELNKSLKKSSLKTSIYVGGVCIVVTAAIVAPLAIYLWDNYGK